MVVETVLSSQPLLSVVFILFFLTSLAYACFGYFCYQIKMHLYSCLFIYYNLHFICLFTDVKCCNCLAFKSEICMTWTCCCNMTSMLLSTHLCQGALFSFSFGSQQEQQLLSALGWRLLPLSPNALMGVLKSRTCCLRIPCF